jgi:hypothetical protein
MDLTAAPSIDSSVSQALAYKATARALETQATVLRKTLETTRSTAKTLLEMVDETGRHLNVVV